MTKSVFIWSPRIKWITVGTLLVFLITIAYSIYVYLHTTDCLTHWITMGAVVLLCMAITIAILLAPRSIDVAHNKVSIRLLCSSIQIPQKEIERIEHLPSGLAAIRIVGMGNFFGNVGLFYSEYCGRYYSFVTNPQDVCLIFRRDKKPIAVSVANASIFNEITDVLEK